MDRRALGAARLTLGIGILAVLFFAYGLRIAAGDPGPFDFFGYFTNQTSALTGVALVAVGAYGLRDRLAHGALDTVRAVMLTCLVVVASVYNLVVPGTGSAPPWVSVTLHAVVPALVLLDWTLIGDRRPLPWRRLWLVLPYPVLWLAIVLARGATDGWVPYGFLLPERGAGALLLTSAALLGTLVAAGTGVWALSRCGGAALRGPGARRA